jgi:hypothetical protein
VSSRAERAGSTAQCTYTSYPVATPPTRTTSQ